MARKTTSTQPTPATTADTTPVTTATPETPATPKAAKLSPRGLPCLCGCGTATHTPAARFLSGHDAKLRKLAFATGLKLSALPEICQPFFIADAAKDKATAGFRVEGDDLIDVKPNRNSAAA